MTMTLNVVISDVIRSHSKIFCTGTMKKKIKASRIYFLLENVSETLPIFILTRAMFYHQGIAVIHVRAVLHLIWMYSFKNINHVRVASLAGNDINPNSDQQKVKNNVDRRSSDHEFDFRQEETRESHLYN